MNNKTRINVKRVSIKFTIILGILICIPYVFAQLHTVQANTENQETQSNDKQYIYLSDIPYDSPDLTEKTSVGWGKLTMDHNLETKYNNGLISLKVGGKNKQFLKGISAHANSKVIFDVSELVSQGFTKFSTYYGVDASRGSNGNAVYFKIVTKTDANAPWHTELEPTPNMKGDSEAGFIQIDLTGKKYIKLEAYGRGGISSAHACYANSKLYKEGYEETTQTVDFIKTVDEYDRLIKEKYNENKFNITQDYELMLLQRELVNSVGYDLLQQYVSLNQDDLDTVKWLMTNIENLKPYIIGGKPEGGSYFNSFKVLSRLYKQRGEDLKDTTKITTTRGDSTLGEMYKTMMLSISLTHSGNVYLWCDGSTVSDALTRYDIYKKLYQENKIECETFASLTVEEMRWVMNTIISDEEIEWLNDHVRKKGNDNPYGYIRYTSGYRYGADKYYSQDQYDNWNNKYSLSDYDITYERGHTRLWIVFEEGAVCGGISKTGSCIWGAYRGLPNTCISQPGHCAYLRYYQNSNGDGYWQIWNNVTNWATSGRTEHLNVRMPNDWQPSGGWAASYIVLAQSAQNEYDKYEKAEEIIMLADVYANDTQKLQSIYRKALQEEVINYDAWVGLINAYKMDESKTEEDWYNLAEEITVALKYYPLPMYNLLNMISPYMTSPAYTSIFNLLENRALKQAANTPNNEFIQADATKQVANYLLGNIDTSIASFSFDGNNAEKIVLSNRFDNMGVTWDYSLDGGTTWTQTSEHAKKLTDEEIASITTENGIKVHIIGVNYSANNILTINIGKSVLPTNLYANDLENSMIGVNSGTQWRYTENDDWTSYDVATPDLTGDKTVQVRQSATGTKLASDPSNVYTFTADNQPDTRKYIRIAHLSIEGYSTQSVDSKRPYYAPNAIDGNINTLWHTDFRYNVLQQDVKPFITIKLDEPKYISALEFVQIKYKPNDPDFIKNGRVYVSEDGENWTEAGRIENCPQNNELRKIEFNQSIYGQYVKLEMDTYNMFASLAMVNLFEDITKHENVNPTAEINYSTQESTNQDVVAKLVNPSTKITITNNDGSDTYIFKENGTFTFEFEDENGLKGSAVATVNWIDKDTPTADVKYNLDSDRKLVILLGDISEDVYLLNENNEKISYIEVKDKKVSTMSYLDSSGNAYKIVEVDENGSTRKVTYTNISDNVPTVDSYVTTIENGIVISEEYFNEDGNSVTISDEEKETLRSLQQSITNPLEYTFENSGEYEFKLLDKASNVAYKTIKADYYNNNNTILASDITYNITKLTNQDVIATINPYIIDTNGKNVNVEITNNNNNKQYTFSENGEFTFEYKDSSDTNNLEVKGHTARVNWIDKEKPTANISYSITNKTNQSVIATLVDESEQIVITNNNGSRTYTFEENGEFTFEFKDMAGNKQTAVAKVGWIEKDDEEYIFNLKKYKQEENYISRIVPETTVQGFKQNVETNQELIFTDKDGNVLGEDSVLATGMKLKVGDRMEYTLVVTGDIDGNGRLGTNDLSKLKLHYIEYELLTGASLKAADIDGNGKVSINDISQLKLAYVGLIKIQ